MIFAVRRISATGSTANAGAVHLAYRWPTNGRANKGAPDRSDAPFGTLYSPSVEPKFARNSDQALAWVRPPP